jgi:hypothetical protein
MNGQPQHCVQSAFEVHCSLYIDYNFTSSFSFTLSLVSYFEANWRGFPLRRSSREQSPASSHDSYPITATVECCCDTIQSSTIIQSTKQSTKQAIKQNNTKQATVLRPNGLRKVEELFRIVFALDGAQRFPMFAVVQARVLVL